MAAAVPTPSPLRSAASRSNGARSRGPKTSEGKARSCRNSAKHGLYSRNPLPIDETELRATTSQFLSDFAPSDPLERAIVHELAVSRCRLRLARILEKQWLDEALAVTGSLGEAFAAVVETAQFRMLQRFEGRAFRNFHSLLATLASHRKFKNDGTNPRTIPDPLQTFIPIGPADNKSCGTVSVPAATSTPSCARRHDRQVMDSATVSYRRTILGTRPTLPIPADPNRPPAVAAQQAFSKPTDANECLCELPRTSGRIETLHYEPFP